MAEKKQAVIIGAGIGGLTTATYLARNGYKVDLYEKHIEPGGRCGQVIRDGHRFDLGATMMLMPDIYHNVFNSLGIKLEPGTDIFPLENLYTIYYDDGSRLAFTTDSEKMKLQLEKIEKGSFERSEKFISSGYKIFKLGIDRLINRNFYHLFQMVNFSNAGLLFRLKVFISNWNYAKRFFRHPHLMMAYTFQNIYVGQSPFDSPALFSMVPAAEIREGSFFVKGGMFGIVQKLLSAAEFSGVQIHLNKAVTDIRIRNRKAEGLLLEDGTFKEADVVVANADLPYVYDKLLHDKKKTKHLSRMKYSCSAVCLHWGLDKAYPGLDHHNVFLSDNFREGFNKIFIDKTISDTPSFYIHAPARTDSDAAPEGQDSLSFIISTGHIDSSKVQDWGEIRQKAHNYVVERLKKAGFTDIEDHIKFEIAYTPESWESACNVSRGSVFGSLGHNILQMGYFRPHNRHDRVHNMYFVGGSTHPGNGIPNVLMSAKLVAERIISGK